MTIPTMAVIHLRGTNLVASTDKRFELPVVTELLPRSNAFSDSPTTWAAVCIRAGWLNGLFPATSKKFVAVDPGFTTITRTPRCRASSWSAWEKLTTNAFVAA